METKVQTKTWAEACSTAKLDWHVLKLPLVGQTESTTVKTPLHGLFRSDTLDWISSCGSRFRILNNIDMFTFIDVLIEKHYPDAMIVECGERGSEAVWCVVDLNMTVPNLGSIMLLLTGDHTGEKLGSGTILCVNKELNASIPFPMVGFIQQKMTHNGGRISDDIAAESIRGHVAQFVSNGVVWREICSSLSSKLPTDPDVIDHATAKSMLPIVLKQLGSRADAAVNAVMDSIGTCTELTSLQLLTHICEYVDNKMVYGRWGERNHIRREESLIGAGLEIKLSAVRTLCHTHF